MGFNALSLVKFAVSGVVGIGTGKIVGRIIKDHVTPETLIDKVTITAAAWVISGVATTATKKYTNDLIDEAAGAVTAVLTKMKLGRINRGESTFEKEGLDQRLFTRVDDAWVPSEAVENPNGNWKFDGKDTYSLTENGVTTKIRKNAEGRWVSVDI